MNACALQAGGARAVGLGLNLLPYPLRRLCALLLLLVLASLLIAGYAHADASRAVVQITTVEIRSSAQGASSADTPPGPEEAFVRTTLPYNWTAPGSERADQLNAQWIRLRFDLSARTSDPIALLVTRVYNGGWVYVNGMRVGGIPPGDERTFVRWRKPLLIELPNALLWPGTNEILIKTTFRSGPNSIPPMEIGPTSMLQEKYETAFFMAHTTPRITALVSFTFGLAFIWFWWLRREQVSYGLLGLAGVFWGIRAVYFWIEFMPLEARIAWRLLYYVGYGGVTACLMMGITRLVGSIHRWVDAAVIAVGMAGVLGALFFGVNPEGVFGRIWSVSIASIAFYAVFLLVRAALQRPTLEVTGLLLSLTLMVVLNLIDFAGTLGLLPIAGPVFAHLSGPVVMIVMGAVLVSRYALAMDRLETVNVMLADRVAAREIELMRKYDEQYEIEQRRITVEERARIMQDMHDGLGSQLLSSLVMVERSNVGKQEMVNILRDALDDLRLAIDAFAPDGAELLPAVGNLRFRMQARFKAAGVKLNWSMLNVPDTSALPATATLPILRVMQESLTNILKHSQATEATVQLRLQTNPPALLVEIADNGVGFEVKAAPGRGRGLPNLQKRANRIGAHLLLESGVRGTRVLLTVPLDSTTASPQASAAAAAVAAMEATGAFAVPPLVVRPGDVGAVDPLTAPTQPAGAAPSRGSRDVEAA
jgi:signal transduction histidine kinase